MVVALWQECGLTRPWNDPHKDIARKLEVQPEWFLVGTAGEELMASVMAGYDGHRGWVNYLAVAPKHRGRGHGKQLMQHVEQLFVQRWRPEGQSARSFHQHRRDRVLPPSRLYPGRSGLPRQAPHPRWSIGMKLGPGDDLI